MKGTIRILFVALLTAAPTSEAIAQGRSTPTDLARATFEDDVDMPGLDGFEVVERIRVRPELAGATVMMLSSSRNHAETARCRDLDVAAYLTKPIQAAALHDAMCRALNHTSTTDAAEPSTTRGTSRAARSLSVLLAEDNVVNQQVAVGLLTKRGHEVTVANNGLEALAASTGMRSTSC